MQLWIDNTGLQSAALCLDGRARPAYDYDVRGLLQLATLVIYSNKVSLNGFEDDVIAERTHEIIDKLPDIGITKDILSICPVTEQEYALACKWAADSSALDLRYRFMPNRSRETGGQPPNMPQALVERVPNYVELAGETEDSAKLENIRTHAPKDKAAGAVEYMMACSYVLRDTVAQILEKYPRQKTRICYQLNAALRYYLNYALAEQSLPKSQYAPAVARAKLVNGQNKDVIKKLRNDQKLEKELKKTHGGRYAISVLGDIMDQTIAELRGKPLGMPSTIAGLLERSKGEPKAILEAAMEFRCHSGPLRNFLELQTAKYPEDTPRCQFEIEQQVKDLSEPLRRAVRLGKATPGTGALEFKVGIGYPPSFSFAVSGSMKNPIEWFAGQIEECKRRRRIAVLTELVKESARSNASKDLYEKLRKCSMEKIK